MLRIGAGTRSLEADDGAPRPAGEPETGWLPFRSSLAVSGNRMRSRNPERGLRMSSLYAEYLPLYGAGGVPPPGHASRRQLVTVMSVCIWERLDEGACCRSSSRENGRASRSMSRYLFRVAAFRCGCAVSSFRLHCLAASRWDGIRWKPFFFIEYKLIFAGQLNSERYVHIACHTGI